VSFVTISSRTTSVSTPDFLSAANSPCYDSEGNFRAVNASEYAQCASSFLSLKDNESFGVTTFSISSGNEYPICFGLVNCNCYAYPSCTYSMGAINRNATAGMAVNYFPVYGVGTAFLLINYNATQTTSIEISQGLDMIRTDPSLNSSFGGNDYGYNSQEFPPGYNLYIPINTLAGFKLVFLNNSTQPDTVTLSMAFVW